MQNFLSDTTAASTTSTQQDIILRIKAEGNNIKAEGKCKKPAIMQQLLVHRMGNETPSGS